MASTTGDDGEPSGMTLLVPHAVSREARAAHDIKNSVSTIVAISALLERQAVGPLRERAARLRAESERLCRLIRAESNGAHGPQPYCVREMAGAVVTRVMDSASRRGVRVELEAEAFASFGDREGLEEALFNLVSNAIDATSSGGGVTVVMRRTAEGDDAWTVRDEGAGIPAAHLADLGTPGSTRKPGGSGYGVAIARSVIAEHDGIVRVDSREGRGTTFTVLIPARASGAMAESLRGDHGAGVAQQRNPTSS